MGEGSLSLDGRSVPSGGCSPPVDGRDHERDRRLLHRHRPYLRYDTQEAYRAVSVASAVRPTESGEDDRLSRISRSLADIVRLQAKRSSADRVYGRVVRDSGRVWLQYWLWYYYDQKQILGFGGHEGDWEMVQVGLDAHDRPEIVTCAHHETADARRWADVERRRSSTGEHPTIYIAPFSHASYFEPGTHFYLGGVDNPDGQGAGVLPRIEPFGDWVEWPGRWGSSPGILARWTGGRLGGRSPASPAHQHRRWKHPARWHRRARRRRLRHAVRHLLWRVGKASYPSCPAISAGLVGDVLVVDYSLSTTLLRRGRYLYLTVHVQDGGNRVLAKQAVRLHGRRGTVAVTLPYRPPSCAVRATAFNFARQRSAGQEATVTQLVVPRVIGSRRRSHRRYNELAVAQTRRSPHQRRRRNHARPRGRRVSPGSRERSPPRHQS
jgi:hypothetical protein